MNFSELVTTARGRRATGKLSLDLLKITGKVAVAGTAGLAGALASAVVSSAGKPSAESDCEYEADTFTNGWQASGPEGPGYYEGGFKLHD